MNETIKAIYSVEGGTSGSITLIHQDRIIKTHMFMSGESMTGNRSFVYKITIEGFSKFCIKVTAAGRTMVHCASVYASTDHMTSVELKNAYRSGFVGERFTWELKITGKLLDAGAKVEVNWGDGSPRDEFSNLLVSPFLWHIYNEDGEYQVHVRIVKAKVANPDLKGIAKVHSRVDSVWCGEKDDKYFVPPATELRILIFIRAKGKLNVTVDGPDIIHDPSREISGKLCFNFYCAQLEIQLCSF